MLYGVVLPEAEYVCPPGNFVIVQLPVGNPLKVTLPFAFEQLGWVGVPTIGVVGIVGTAFIVLELTAEVHELLSVTVKL